MPSTFRRPSRVLLWALLVLPGLLTAAAADAHFRVTDAVQVSTPRPIGLNVHVAREYQAGRAQDDFNLWSRLGHPERFYTVLKGVATGGSATHLENRREPFASFRGTFRDGWFAGARIRVYRHSGDTCNPLRTATVAAFAGGAAESPNRFDFDAPGPAVQAGDEYVVELATTGVPPGLTLPDGTAARVLEAAFLPRPAGSEIVLDPTTAPPGGGRASLRARFPAAGSVRLPQWYPPPPPPPAAPAVSAKTGPARAEDAVPQSHTWVQFGAGRTFEFAGWFRQEAGGRGRLRVRCGALAEREFDLGAEWREVRFTFAGGPPDRRHPDLEIGLTAAGTLWLDNFAVTERTAVAAPFSLYPEMQAAVRAFRPGFLRIWPLQSGIGSVPPLEDLVRGYFGQPWLVDGGRLRAFAMADLHDMLQLCLDTGALPWIVVSTFYPPESWTALLEYLAGPADSPFGRLRAARGRSEPWMTAFGRVWLEAGNEVWNGLFQPQDFARRPEDYARYADLMFRTARQAPHFDPARFQFIANGFISSLTGFTETVARTGRQADFVDVANYIGGWEAGATDTAASGDIAFQSRLLYGATTGRDLVREVVAVLQRVNAGRPRPLGGAVYEGGPGYSLPGAKVPIDWDEQNLGKSLASAIGTLDQYFNYTAAGIDLIGHFNFGRGHYWNTHAEDRTAWRPHAVTLACQLRNEYGRGDLLRVETLRTPTIDLPVREILQKRNDGSLRRTQDAARASVPLVGCHAFRDGAQFAVFMLSRTLAGDTTVALDLPWRIAGPVTLARLAGDSPRAHNTHETQVRIVAEERSSLDFQRIVLPPHTVLVVTGRIRE
jgi:hypothetical protein